MNVKSVWLSRLSSELRQAGEPDRLFRRLRFIAACFPPRDRNVSRNYATGLQVVLGTILVSGAICGYSATRTSPPVPRAAQDLGASARPVGPFRLVERSGREVTDRDLEDRVA